MGKTVSVRAEFQYYYVAEAGDGEGSEYKCPFGSKEKFLEAFGMKDIGICPWHSGYRMAEKIFEIPVEGQLVHASLRENEIGFSYKAHRVFDKKYSPIGITTRHVPGNNYFMLWIEERKDWVCIKENSTYLWEAGSFNEHMTGPYSVDSSLEAAVSQAVKDLEPAERSIVFSFEKIHRLSVGWLYDKLKKMHAESRPEKGIILADELGKKIELESMSKDSLRDFLEEGAEYTATLVCTKNELRSYVWAFREFDELTSLLESAKSSKK